MDQIKNIILQTEELKSKGDFESASKLIEDNIVKYSDDYRLYEELADIYLYTGHLDKATKAIDFALELNNESATGNYLKGFIFLSNDKTKDAIIFLEKSNGLMGNNAEVLRNLGWAYTLDGNPDKGITILQRALTIAPGDELITEDLAMALIGAGDINKGNDLLKKIGKKK